MKWTIGLFVGFGIMFAVDFAYAYLASAGADPVVSSYNTEHR